MTNLKEAVEQHFRANMLDGDKVQDGQMLSAQEVLDYITNDLPVAIHRELVGALPKENSLAETKPVMPMTVYAEGYNQALLEVKNVLTNVLGMGE